MQPPESGPSVDQHPLPHALVLIFIKCLRRGERDRHSQGKGETRATKSESKRASFGLSRDNELSGLQHRGHYYYDFNGANKAREAGSGGILPRHDILSIHVPV